MKLAFVGSFSTGKTTMANLMARELDLPLLPEAARQVVELGFPLDQSATAETEALIFLKSLLGELSHAEFVADRSMLDMLAYADWVMENQKESRKEDHLWLAAREIAVLDLRSRYDHVFYLPIEFPIVLDGLRPDDTGFQAEIDDRMVQLMHVHDVAHHTLSGSIEERRQQVLAITGSGGR